MSRGYFVSGIGTGIGKTVVAAVLCEAFEADYWKPVQAGAIEDSDSNIVADLISNSSTVVFPETFKLNTPVSPHLASQLDGCEIRLNDFSLPQGTRPLIVEGAGGLLVPLNERELVIDLIAVFNLPVILVSKNYLGSINHTLLSLEALKLRQIPVAALVFNGETNRETESIICKIGEVSRVIRIPTMELNRESVMESAQRIRQEFYESN